MQRHLRKYHDVTSMHKFSCQEENCGRSYTKLDTLFKHIKKCHSNPESIHHAVVPENRDRPEKQKQVMCDKVPQTIHFVLRKKMNMILILKN